MSRPRVPMLSKSHDNRVNNWLHWKDLLYLHYVTGRKWFEIFLQAKQKCYLECQSVIKRIHFCSTLYLYLMLIIHHSGYETPMISEQLTS